MTCFWHFLNWGFDSAGLCFSGGTSQRVEQRIGSSAAETATDSLHTTRVVVYDAWLEVMVRCGEKGGICDTMAVFDIKHSALPSMEIESWNVGYDEYITSHIIYHIIYYNISYCINLYNMMIKYMVYPYNMYKMPYIHMIYSNWVLFGSKGPSYPERFWRRLFGWNATT